MRSALLLALLLPAIASAQDAPKPAETAPRPAPEPPKDAPKPAPVVLDPATLAKLREVAYDAAREGDVRTLEEYFKAGQPADIANAKGDTLLILAAYHGRDDAVRAILAQPRAAVDARNKMGFTALTGASYKGYVGIVRQLADGKADLDLANAKGQTALMYAAMFGRAEVVKFLVERRVDVKIKDDAGKTARDLAESQGNAEVGKLLADAEKPRPVVE